MDTSARGADKRVETETNIIVRPGNTAVKAFLIILEDVCNIQVLYDVAGTWERVHVGQ